MAPNDPPRQEVAPAPSTAPAPIAVTNQPPAELQPPPISEFWKWIEFHLRRDWRKMITETPLGTTALFLGTVLVCCVIFWKAIVPYKDVQIESGTKLNGDLTTRLSNAEKDKEELRKSLEIAIADKATPLKTKVNRMAKDLLEFADKLEQDNKNNSAKGADLLELWHDRLHPRFNTIILELDQAGQSSDQLNWAVGRLNFIFLADPKVFKVASTELSRLANNLPNP